MKRTIFVLITLGFCFYMPASAETTFDQSLVANTPPVDSSEQNSGYTNSAQTNPTSNDSSERNGVPSAQQPFIHNENCKMVNGRLDCPGTNDSYDQRQRESARGIEKQTPIEQDNEKVN